MLARRALAAAPDRALEVDPGDLDAAADGHVVDGDAGVLAEEVLGLLGDADVGDHRAEHALRGRIALRRGQAREALLHVRRQDLERAHVELARDLLDLCGIDLHCWVAKFSPP